MASLEIVEKVEGTAEWRRMKADQFPDDARRNIEAAEELERLAREIHAFDDAEIERQINDAEDRITSHEEATENYGTLWVDINETVSEELRSFGFRGAYGTVGEFLEWYRDLLTEKLKDSTDSAYDLIEEAVPAPDLEQQVENDPRVAAAKRAYEEARAKVLAEVRKTV